jgi:hypothetical protein
MYIKQNHPYNPVLCDECGCERRVLLSLTAFDLCLGCLEEANKTAAAWKKERRDYVLTYPHLMNARGLDEKPHQVVESKP